MYRVIAIVGAGLALAACSSTPDWMNLSSLKPAPLLDTVRFESNPPGADVKTSNGQSCRTPCALALPTETPLTATFTLSGYLPETDNIDPVSITGSPPQLQPNPVAAELEAAPPPAKPMKKPVPKKKTAAAKPAAAKPAPAPSGQQPASPWPAPAPAQR
jgi:hypothetical protein